MLLGKRKASGPIGVDIDDDEVRLVQVECHADRVKLLAAARRELPADLPEQLPARHAAIARIVADTVFRRGFSGRRLVVCVPPTAVRIKNLRLPRIPAEEVPGAIEWEAKDRLQLDHEPHLMRYFDAGEVRQGDDLRREIILLALPTAFAESLTTAFIEKNFQLDAIEAPPASIARLVQQTAAGNRPVTVVDVRRRATTVVVVGGGRVLFVKSIAIGGVDMDAAAAAQLDLPVSEAKALRWRFDRDEANPVWAQGPGEPGGPGTEEDVVGEDSRRAVFEAVRPMLGDLAREVALCLRYFGVTFRGERPSTVLLSGPESESRWLTRLMIESAAVSVGVLDPLSRCETTGSLLQDAPAHGTWATAVGSAMRRTGTHRVTKEAA